MLNTKAPYSDVRVRQALNYDIDRDSIVKGIFGGLTKPMRSPLMPGLAYYAEQPAYHYNPDSAKQLLTDAGYGTGLQGVLLYTIVTDTTVKTTRRTVRRGAPLSWRVLIYRVPSEPASKRVSVWRDLKRIGALYLQQCVCIFPDIPGLAADVEQISARIPALGGETFLVKVPRLEPQDEARIVEAFRVQRTNEYAEIIEECETKFVKEIEFEHFRQNYTFGEAEEIEQDLDKIRRWFDRVRDRDWFKADRRDEVEAWLARCQGLLARFEEEVYRRQGSGAEADDKTETEPTEDELAPRPMTPLRPPRSKRTRTKLSALGTPREA